MESWSQGKKEKRKEVERKEKTWKAERKFSSGIAVTDWVVPGVPFLFHTQGQAQRQNLMYNSETTGTSAFQQNRGTWVQILTLTLPCCVTLDKWLNLSELQFPPL